jgi:hypothetical protein
MFSTAEQGVKRMMCNVPACMGPEQSAPNHGDQDVLLPSREDHRRHARNQQVSAGTTLAVLIIESPGPEIVGLIAEPPKIGLFVGNSA